MRDVTVTSPVSGSVFFTAEEVVGLLIAEVVAMMCDAHFGARRSWFYCMGAFWREARTVRRIDWEIFADDDVGGVSATRSWINSAHSH